MPRRPVDPRSGRVLLRLLWAVILVLLPVLAMVLVGILREDARQRELHAVTRIQTVQSETRRLHRRAEELKSLPRVDAEARSRGMRHAP